MLKLVKEHKELLISILLVLFVTLYLYGCEPTTPSLNGTGTLVNRGELQLELEQIIALAEIRLHDIERQERLRQIITENALVLVQGQPFNPLGLLTGVAALYGITQGGSNIGRVVNTARKKRKVDNGTG